MARCIAPVVFVSILILLLVSGAVPASAAEPAPEDVVSPPESPPAGTDPDQLPVMRGTVDVVAELPQVPSITTIDTDALRSGAPIGDGAEVLRAVPGLSLGRMGGHGLEPVIRGLAQTNLNVLIDGAYIHGGCPNRMDPPTSFADAASYDEVVVIRGVQTLRYGGGGVGGTVLYQRHAPTFGDELDWRGEAAVGFSTVLDGPDASLDASVGTDRWSLRLVGSIRDQDNYEDGDGNEVRSAFESQSATALLGWSVNETTRLEASVERLKTDDVLFAGAGMDAPYDRTWIYRLRVFGDPVDGGSLRWSATVYHDTVDHLMDNYSLRELTAPMAMRVPTTSDTSGGRAMAEWELASWRVAVGGDWQLNRRDATRFAGPNPDMVETVQSIMWPDVEIENAGVFSEATLSLAERLHLTGGLRVDRWDAEARDADRSTMGGAGPSPRMLWSLYYPGVESSWQDTTVGGLVRVDWSMRRGTLFAGLSRTARAADATERFLGANSPSPMMRWVGNPTLEPAVHNQLELGYEWSAAGAAFQVSVFADRVDDFILRDRSHGQPDVLRDDGAFVYRNVEAERLGGEISGRVELAPRLALDGSVSYVWVENTTDDRPVAEIPPLDGRVALTWRADRWSAGGAVRGAAKQTRVDADPMTGSGLDTGETPSWAVLDLSGSLRLGFGFDLVAGIDNLLDDTYATHLNRASVFDPVPVQVNEPGRVLWARLRWSGGR
ncbi:MAG TPA: TonB-dependent copper receptor [Candidatus Sulfomarinibacteraceae bacterium]|nr:TonB-dependent copper receptor [Candidatus Sulfomarinibacteraceae bacterium]